MHIRERHPSELKRGGFLNRFVVIEADRRAEEAETMALSEELRERVADSVVEGGLSRNAAPSISESASPAP